MDGPDSRRTPVGEGRRRVRDTRSGARRQKTGAGAARGWRGLEQTPCFLFSAPIGVPARPSRSTESGTARVHLLEQEIFPARLAAGAGTGASRNLRAARCYLGGWALRNQIGLFETQVAAG